MAMLNNAVCIAAISWQAAKYGNELSRLRAQTAASETKAIDG